MREEGIRGRKREGGGKKEEVRRESEREGWREREQASVLQRVNVEI